MSNLGLHIAKELGRDYVWMPGDTDNRAPVHADKVGRLDNNKKGNDNKPADVLAGWMRNPGWPSDRVKGAVERRLTDQAALIAAARGQDVSVTAQDRALTGIGERSPLMVGLHLDWTLGWPVFPGAGLKGMTRAWVENWADTADLIEPCGRDDSVMAACYACIFGEAADGDDPGWAGEVIFLDGIIVPGDGNPLILDVMTPHYNDYLVGDGFDPAKNNTTPADWNDPRPITYLTVKKGATLKTGLLPRSPDALPALPVAAAWMKMAFAQIGAGAKTKEGKGRFA